MAAQGGGAQGGFDYNQWAAMNLNKGGETSAPADTLDDITKKGIDKAMGTVFAKFLGIMDPSIEGRGVIPNETNVGTGLAFPQGGMLGIFRDTGGVLAQILKYFTRDLPAGLMEAISGPGEGGSASGGGGEASSGSSSSGGDYASAQMGSYSGGNDFSGGPSSMGSMGGAAMESAEMVSYGGKMIASSVPEVDLGQLRPQATPVGDDRMVGRGDGMGMG